MKKGFTLVELLAVIIIIGIVFGLAAINITKILDKSTEQQYEMVSDMVAKAALLYVETEKPAELEIIGGLYCVTLQNLYDKGLIDLPLINPKTNESFATYTCVYVENGSDGLVFDFNKDDDDEDTIISAGLIVDLPMGDYKTGVTFNDRSGNVNNASSVGTALVPDRFNVANKATSFDGIDDLLTFTLTPPQNNFTYSFWAKSTATHDIDYQTKDGTYGDAGQKYAMYPTLGTATTAGSGLSIGTNGISVYGSATAYLASELTFTSNLSTDWVHVTVVYTNRKPSLYVNGTLVRTGYASTSIPMVTAPINIGGGAYGRYAGYLDEYKLYNRSLTSSEVLHNYKVEATPVDKKYVDSKVFESIVMDPRPNTLVTNGLIADFPIGNNSYVDWFLSRNNIYTYGKSNGINLTASRKGVANAASQFDGISDILNFSYNDTIPTNNFTVSLWVKATVVHEIDVQSNVAANTAGTAGQKYTIWPELRAGNAGMGLSVGTNGITVYEQGTGYFAPILSQTIAIGTNWTQITIVYTNKQPTLYVNGTFNKTGLTSTYPLVYAPFRLGGGTNGYFAGSIDDFYLYNRALSAEEVAQNYNAGA